MPQALDLMVLIGELVKALNLYSNPGVGNHSHVNKNSNARDASKKFWMQRLNLIKSFWYGPCASLLFFVTIVLWFLFSLFLEFALHNIHAFHSRLFCLSFSKKKKKEKKELNCVLHYFLGFWEQGWSIHLHITCLLYLV